MSEKFSLKDHLVNPKSVAGFAQLFEDAGVFKAAPFVKTILPALPDLELKARLSFIAEVLAQHLPSEYSAACEAILAALPPPLDPSKTDDDFGLFIHAPFGIFVEDQGMGAQDVSRSLDMIEALTQRFSMEFSVRPFLSEWTDQTMERMGDWVHHDNYHVRRLVSEGTRLRLPWGRKIPLAYDAALPLLDVLHGDHTRYVTRSVSNHLNDITKVNPEMVVERLGDWAKRGQQGPKELDWMTRHALRGLVKSGHGGALQLLGFRPDPQVSLCELTLDNTEVARGGRMMMEAVINVARIEPMIIDYVIDFMKANGETKSKVFKWKTLTATPDQPVHLTKSHFFKDGATTFTLYPGAHAVRLQINGRLFGPVAFEMT